MPNHIRTTTIADENTVRYMDASALERPFDLPMSNKLIVGVILAAAIVIGIIMGQRIINTIWNGDSAGSEGVEAAVNRGVTLDLPVLSNFIGMSGPDITANLTASGATIFDYKALNASDTSTGIDLIKLPSDVSLTDAGLAYAQGISKMNATQAATYLTGSWRLQTGTTEYIDYKIKYADFTSNTIDAAIASAITTEGFTTSDTDSSGVDASGNTYVSGTMDIGGVTYQWQVSACPLKEVYSINGLPSTALYVGIRLYQ